MPRAEGSKNRNYPELTLEQALVLARVIQDGASGMAVTKLTLAELVDRSPSSSAFRKMLLASRAYGLTSGGVNADEFELTQLGQEATGADEVTQMAALRKAVMNIEPFRTFLTSYSGKKVPSPAAFKEFLTKNAAVPPDRAQDCIDHILADARTTGLLRRLKGSDYIDLTGTPHELADEEEEEEGTPRESVIEVLEGEPPGDAPVEKSVVERSVTPKKVFIAHGKNRSPLDQLKKMLDQIKVPYAVAVDEPHRGRPISAKVASLMRNDCSSAIFIFTADERFLQEKDGETEEVWRPSENVVYELGAASMLYDRRIVIFKEKGVNFPSDFSDLGYIEFESGQLVEQMGNLFSELVALDILEVRAKG